jgi:periplasmic protein CpxP/Spy
MKPHRRHLLAAAVIAAAGLGALAQAQTPAAPGSSGRPDAARMEQFHARMQQRMAERLGELKQKLAITPAQEGSWSTWTAALQPALHQRPDRAQFQSMTTPERIDQMRALRAQRSADMDRRMDATKTFYGSLSAEQKKVFDAESARFLARGEHHGHRGHHGGEQQRG